MGAHETCVSDTQSSCESLCYLMSDTQSTLESHSNQLWVYRLAFCEWYYISLDFKWACMHMLFSLTILLQVAFPLSVCYSKTPDHPTWIAFIHVSHGTLKRTIAELLGSNLNSRPVYLIVTNLSYVLYVYLNLIGTSITIKSDIEMWP